ncbi:MAG: PDZ domain-containing protein [Acidobacteriota bacterium]
MFRSIGFSRRILPGFLVALNLAFAGTAFGRAQDSPIRYLLDLRKPASHLVYVTMSVPEATAGTEFQIPTWNNLYQIRDFVRDVQDVQAECNGKPSLLDRVDINTWKSADRCSDLEVHYAVYANQDNVFSAILDSRHALLNFALLLFYLPRDRQRPVLVKFLLPEGWKLVTMLQDGPMPGEYQAPDYDHLVDSPAEAGTFQQYDYVQKGATFRVVVDGNRNLYSPKHLVAVLRKITASETALMHDVPFKRYTFMFFFPQRGGGGMEHRNGTAISVPAGEMRRGLLDLEGTAAHEFFHLWNVKRIRPMGLEPIDYIHGNDTSDLWFCEGVTSMYSEIVLLRSGLIKKKEFYTHLAAEIKQLESRPARHFQSAEQSGRGAWLEKYADYFRPQRSISYYNKGELLGYLLDLGIRHASGNRHSLDDLMRRLNQDFAKRHRFYDDADLERIISQLAPNFPCNEFFRDYVDGTRELDYAKYLGYAGLELKEETAVVPDLGFQSLQSFIGPVHVESVDPNSNAEKAGIQSGDILLKMNGVELPVTPDRELVYFKPGQRVTFTVQRGAKILEIAFDLGSKSATVYKVEETPHATPAQLKVRRGWLKGETARTPVAGN